ncbi:heat shock 70 kDa protein 12A-like, partial [Mercenaria mercenaria]|uniref:heat shock 70 kDa protein 12A-like n=1 Tax=Mercenaria mercenaria TaxID=6596 RepID=UPI00234EB8AC
MDATWRKKLLVAAIDFGTTSSGFALSLLKDYENDKTKIFNYMWKPNDQPRTHKTPTCVLLKPDKSFHSFGFEAEEKYIELAEDDKHKDWRFFRRFKMKLYKPSDRNTCGLSLHSTIKDTEGRDFSALAVFSYSIDYMKRKIIEIVRERFPAVREDDISYVLTTPAIWSEDAKQFMRKAALNAHIPTERLRIALEPECAAVYVHTKELPALDKMTQDKLAMKPGSCHVIIDLGGGTLDIAAHRVNDDCQFEEVIVPDGGPLGGDNINMKYDQFLVKLSGGPAFSKFRDENMEDYLTMQRLFENKKCAFKDTSDDSKVNISIPESFRTLHEMHNQEKLTESVRQMAISDDVEFKADKMRIKTKLFRSFFTETIDGVLNTVECVLSKMYEKIDTLTCVGGFSDCQLLKDAFHAKFPDQTVIIPEEAVTSIMKGAIIFGRDQSVVNKRISRYTYGLDWNEDFDPDNHDPSKREETDNGHVCRDIFRKLIGKGDEVPYNKPTQEIEAFVKSKYQTVIDFPFYRSEIEENPKYIDAIGCHLIGTMRVNLGESKIKSLDRYVKLKVYFGETELRAEAIDDTGKKYDVTINIE